MSGDSASLNPRSILVISSVLAGDDQLLAALRAHGEVHTVESADDALAALRTGRFDLVLSRPSELFPLARAEARQRAELVLEQIGQGVCIVDRGGELVWGNTKFRSYPAPVVAAIRQHCAELCKELVVGHRPADSSISRRRIVNIGQEYVFDLTASPLLTAEHQVAEVVGLALDVTATHRLREKINAIDAAGREMVRLDAEALGQLDASERLSVLEEKIIRFTRDFLHFDHFAVRILDKSTNQLETVIATGLPEVVNVPISATVEGSGISGHVAATRRSYICPDVSQDPRYLPGLDRPGSSLTVPLWLHDQLVGVLNVESHEIAAFTEDDRQFAEIFGYYIAIALHILRLLVVERSTTTGQIASDVSSELAAPLNDIVAEATGTMESYIGQDDLRRRLEAIIGHVDRMKRSLQMISETPGVKGLVPQSSSKDPVISGRRILIAEDEEIIRETIADVLSNSGALTVAARDGQEAVAMIHAQHFDLVVSDIKMPYRDGYEVFAAVKEANIHCPVILITGFGYDPDHLIVRASREGLAGVLFKPFKVEQLVDAVHQALAN